MYKKKTRKFTVKSAMERIIFLFLSGFVLSIHCESSRYTVTSCYGTNKNCDYIYLNCSSLGTIRILKAEYLFNNNSDCQLQGLPCNTKQDYGCCDLDKGNSPTNFTAKNMTTLTRNCSERVSCESQSPWKARKNIINGTEHVETSTMVRVEYICLTDVSPMSRGPSTATTSSNSTTNRLTRGTTVRFTSGTTVGHAPLTDFEETNTAAIVVPIVAVVIIIVAAAIFLLYWRSKRKKENDKQGNVEVDHIVRPPEQIPGYFDKIVNSSKDVDKDDPAQENTYHTIDPKSVEDQKHAVAYDNLVLDPENEHNAIEPNSN